jgi:diadenylate cyclase
MGAVAVVVSESSVVRIFDDGQMVGEIVPELWLLRRYGVRLKAPYSVRQSSDVSVATKKN